ncbi:MAG: copper homeostasis protein CutC [Pirellulaceae bacterium]
MNERPRDVFVEVCIGSLEDARIVDEAGWSHVELNVGLPLGGLTPSMGLVKRVLDETNLNVVAMCRPRPGGFCYSQHEWRTFLTDADLLVAAGVNGLAFGVLNDQGGIETARVAELRERFPETTLVFHRAFDLLDDASVALEQLIDLGIDRVLTSGGEATAWDGRLSLKRLIEQSQGRMEILMGSGVSAQNARDLLRETGGNAIHGSFSIEATDPCYPRRGIRFGPNDNRRQCDKIQLIELRRNLEN